MFLFIDDDIGKVSQVLRTLYYRCFSHNLNTKMNSTGECYTLTNLFILSSTFLLFCLKKELL